MTETLEAQQERWNTETEARITEVQEKAERDRLREIEADRLAFQARSIPEVPDVSELEQRVYQLEYALFRYLETGDKDGARSLLPTLRERQERIARDKEKS